MGPVIDVGGGQVCMGGQMPHRRPNQVSGPSVTHPMGEAAHGGVTRGKGRIENKGKIATTFFIDIMQT